MNKKLFGFILILVVFLSYPSAFAVEPILKAEPEIYCKNLNSWAEWSAFVKKKLRKMVAQSLSCNWAKMI